MHYKIKQLKKVSKYFLRNAIISSKVFGLYFQVICFFYFASLGQTAIAATRYLDSNVVGGNDDGASWENAWDTLAKAQAGLSDGDTVLIKTGSYGDFIETNISHSNWITYKAETGNNPVFTKIVFRSRLLYSRSLSYRFITSKWKR